MYKLLLSWRYLRTRYIALASIISVTLGVGTLIVVNSVMAGFTREMHVRLHGILSPPVERSRVLEVGCAVGGNLASLAMMMPGARSPCRRSSRD